MPDPIPWLLTGAPWVVYRTRVDLLGQSESDIDVRAAHAALLTDVLVQDLLAELHAWPGRALKSHKDAGHPLHKLSFIAELGLQISDPGVDAVVARVLEHTSLQGPFQILTNVPKHFGGSGQDQWTWSLCDAPLLVYALAKLGLAEDAQVLAAAQYLAGLVRPNGWGCSVAPELGRFRGPGRKGDPCPYANLVMLKALAELPMWRDSEVARQGAEAALTLWSERREQYPYLFHMGTDFCKLKAPLVWYDILHVTDVLSRYPWLRSDPRLREMAQLCAAKVDAEGRYTAESVWKAWGDWEFGQKRSPSRWLTLLVLRIQRRLASS